MILIVIVEQDMKYHSEAQVTVQKAICTTDPKLLSLMYQGYTTGKELG